MKKIEKVLKLLALICLIVLAGFGIGLSGGIPIPSSIKRQDTIEVNIELVESEVPESDMKQNSIKQ